MGDQKGQPGVKGTWAGGLRELGSRWREGETTYWRGTQRVGGAGNNQCGDQLSGSCGREYGVPRGYSVEGREGLEPWKEEASKAWERVGAGWGLEVTRTWPRAWNSGQSTIPPGRNLSQSRSGSLRLCGREATLHPGDQETGAWPCGVRGGNGFHGASASSHSAWGFAAETLGPRETGTEVLEGERPAPLGKERGPEDTQHPTSLSGRPLVPYLLPLLLLRVSPPVERTPAPGCSLGLTPCVHLCESEVSYPTTWRRRYLCGRPLVRFR